MEFGIRLFSIMIERNISNADLSKRVGISTARISNFCNGKDMPSLNNALLLANYFQCTLDYLLGNANQYNTITNIRAYDANVFLKKIDILLSANLLTKSDFADKANINISCFSNWRKGQKPKARNLIKMAQILNCSIDYLLGFEN